MAYYSGSGTVQGGSGADTISGSTGNDTLDGRGGADFVDYSANSTAGVTVDLANDSVTSTDSGTDTLISIEGAFGSNFADVMYADATDATTLIGNGGNDSLTGGSGNDSLDGGDDDDSLIGGAGSDTLTGGGGIDTINYTSASGAVNINLSTGSGDDGEGDTDSLSGIESVIGSAFADVLVGDGSANTLTGGAGNDTLTGGSGGDTFVIDSTSSDTITDFDISDGDTLDMSGAGVSLSSSTLSQSGSDVLVDLGGGNTLTVQNVTLAEFNAEATVAGLTNRGVTEDVATNLDLSGVTIDDTDTPGNITVTITATDTGAVLTAADGSLVGTGVTASATGNVVTLVGTADDITSYLDTTTHITYTTSENNISTDTLSILANDGISTNAASTAFITITNVNDLPTASASVISTNDSTARVLTVADFNFSDVDNDTLTEVRIDFLTLNSGTFQLSGAGVIASDQITVADINAGFLTYTPASGSLGDDQLVMTFSVEDGTGYSVSPATMNISVVASTAAPTSSGGSGSVVAGSSLSFDGSSFNFADANSGDTLASVRIDSLPTVGTLKLSGVNVTAGQVITAADIANLTYSAPSGSAKSVSFTYSVSDGTDFAESPATMAVTVTATPVQPNNPPTAPSLSGLSLQENSPGAVVGSVNSNDPDIDPISYSVSDSRFEIVGGTLKLKAGQSVDFETQQTIGLTITATDSNNASQSSSFTLTVRDVNEAGSTDGDDAITGVDGDDNIKSESGDDVVSSGNGRDTIDGGSGNDDIDGGSDDDLLFGGTGEDTIKGGTGEDTVRGGSGSDMVEAGSGNDLVFAGLGDDGNDTVDGDIGNDTLGGGVGSDNIDGGDGDDLMWGEVGDDSLSGGDGNDLIYNGEGSDTVNGGTGDDTIWAGEDDDLLTGGAGADLFVFGDVSGNDTITDFEIAEDVLDVEYASTDFTSLADVVAAGSETSQGGQDGVLLDLGDSDSVFIIGIQLDDLTASNVTF